MLGAIIPPRLVSYKQLDLFKSNPDAAPIDFLTAAWPNWVETFIHIFQIVGESGSQILKF